MRNNPYLAPMDEVLIDRIVVEYRAGEVVFEKRMLGFRFGPWMTVSRQETLGL
jgi:hypothetical protein